MAVLINFLTLFIVSCLYGLVQSEPDLNDGFTTQDSYEIEGKVFPPDNVSPNTNWQTDTIVTVKGGYHLGFLR